MATLTWKATQNGNWSTAGNWDPSGPPVAADTAVLDGSAATDFSFVNDITIQSLSVNHQTALITVSGTLGVTGNTAIQAGTLDVVSGAATLNDLANQGSITVGASGLLELTGTYDSGSVQRIFGAGGTLGLLGTMLNTGKVFDTAKIGAFHAIPATGTIAGGTITGEPRFLAVYDGVTWQGLMDVLFAVPDLRFRNGLTVTQSDGSSPGTIFLRNGRNLVFEGNATLDNLVVEAVDDGINVNAITADGTLTLGATSRFSVVGSPTDQHNLALLGTGSTSTIINHGTVEAHTVPGSKAGTGWVTIDVAEFRNHGLVSTTGEDGGLTNTYIRSDRFINEAGGVVAFIRGVGLSNGAVSAGVDFTNNGSFVVSGGMFHADSAVGGTGTFQISNNGSVDFNSAVGAGQMVVLDASGTVDIATPQLFQGTITGLTTGTTLHIDSQATAIAYGSNVLTMQLGGGQTFTLNIMGASSLSDFIVNAGTTGTTISTILPAPCFAAGTLIRTDRGDVPVEALHEGDRIQLADEDGFRAAIWIGHREVDCARHPDPAAVWPVRVSAHAFGPGQPARDLFLSPDHAIFFENVLIPVKYLINGQTITQVPVAVVSYFHVELDGHDVILAEGLPVESYLDTGDRDAFDNGDTAIRLFPVFGNDPNLIRAARGRAPLVVTGPVLAAVRTRTSRHDSLVA